MRWTRNFSLVFFFLAIIFGVPVAQVLLDLADDEPPQLLELFAQAPTEEHLRQFEEELEEHSFFEQNIRPVYQLAAYFALRDMGSKALRGADGWYFYRPGVQYLFQPYYRDSAALMPEGGDPLEVIRDFWQQLRRRGISLLVVTVPGKASIYPDRLSARADPVMGIYANTSRFLQELEQAGVETLDLHRVFLSARPESDRRGESLYLRSDTHWTGRGIALAAGAIAARIREELWYREMDPRPANRYRTRKVLVERRGDIPRMTKIPLQQILFDSEHVEVRQVFDRQTGELYQDDPQSPILLLGDSFSRIFQSDEPRSAGIIANLAHELQIPLASIVNDGGASTLVRQQLARDPTILWGKRLVIWEFVERDIRFGMRGWEKIEIAQDP